MMHNGVDQNIMVCCGVALMVDQKWVSWIVNYVHTSERITQATLRLNNEHLMITLVHSSKESQEVSDFYEQLQNTIDSCNKTDNHILLENFNAHVGNHPIS
jgi:hypothetical protein